MENKIKYRIKRCRLFQILNDYEENRIKENYIKRTDCYQLEVITNFLDSIKKGFPLKNIIVWNDLIIEGSLKISILSLALKKDNDITYYYDLSNDSFGYNHIKEFEELQIPLYWFADGEYYLQFLENIKELKDKKLYMDRYKNFASNLFCDVSFIEVYNGSDKQLTEFLNKLKQ
jgi:hypothetical protein